MKDMKGKVGDVSYEHPIDSLASLLPTMVATAVIMGVMRSLIRKKLSESYIWIKSPHGNYYRLPLYQAIRVVKKREWEIADTEPIMTKPTMTRWQHLKRALIR